MTSKAEKQQKIPERIRVFDRQQIAKLLGVAPALVRNWSVGRPIKIEPSVRVSRSRGAANLYTLRDVYLFGVAAWLVLFGIETKLVNTILTEIKNNPQWLEKRSRFILVAFYETPLAEGRVTVFHQERKSSDHLPKTSPLAIFFDLKKCLDSIDECIQALEEKESFTSI